MDSKTLIDGIVRQTTVLIAQLSTATGTRAPLARVADQVFLDLTRELERQRVRKKVVADMFGMALRTYQKKVRRLEASGTERDRTLWEALADFLGREGPVSRARIRRQFARDDDASVSAVLQDMVDSGVAYSTGKGSMAVYRATEPADRDVLSEHEQRETIADFVWLTVFRGGPMTVAAIAEAVGAPEDTVGEAIESLVEAGRVSRRGEGTYEARSFLVPVGSERGWEAAVFDHFQAVATAIAAKVGANRSESKHDDTVGGATLTFDVDENHPFYEEVLSLLQRTRRQVNALWEQVEKHNEQELNQKTSPTRVTFYFGQSVFSRETNGGES